MPTAGDKPKLITYKRCNSTKGRTRSNTREYTYVDLFAGCGGLSLGLIQAGWKGLFAIEKDSMAFETLKRNLITSDQVPKFDWPNWLPVEPCDVATLVDRYRSELESIKGMVTMVVGGLPCQGFSFAGKRDSQDHRNRLFEHYVRVVDLLSPMLVLLENVRGMAVPFSGDKNKTRNGGKSYTIDDEITTALRELGYVVYNDLINAANYGVPQARSRYIIIATKVISDSSNAEENPLSVLENIRADFLRGKGLPTNRHVTLKEAISDLERKHGAVPCTDYQRFQQGLYGPSCGPYQDLVRINRDGSIITGEVPDSHRFANHKDTTVENFRKIMKCERGVQLSHEDRERLGIGKHVIVPLANDVPCHTLTTLPDDCLHYSEARIFTVREYARIQSFPDWFEFHGKYTTGGKARTHECPRYTQVGNAVPPLVGEALGLALKKFLETVPLAYQPECKTQGTLELTVVGTE